MNVVACPNCNRAVSRPDVASDQATVQCPLCDKKFPLFMTRGHQPPELAIIEDPSPLTSVSSGDATSIIDADAAPVSVTQDMTTDQAASDVSEGGESGADQYEIEVEPDSDVPAFDFEEAPAPQGEVPSYRIATSLAPSTRQRPAGKGMFGQMVGVIFGGLMAIPLAQICLWWIFGQDPVHLGPAVSEVVPFIVPSAFRAVGEEGDFSSLPDLQTGKLIAEAGTSSGDDASQNLTSGNDGVSDAQQVKGMDRAGQGTLPESPLDTPSVPNASFQFETTDVDIRKVKQTDADSIQDAVQTAVRTQLAWQAAVTGSDLKSLDDASQEYFAAVCLIGESILFADFELTESAQAIGLADTLLQDHLGLQDRQGDRQLESMMSRRSIQWLDDPASRSNSGALVMGTVTGLERVGKFYEIEVELLNAKGRIANVYGWIRPPEALAIGKRVVILGAIVPQPREELGLDTDDDEAVFGGYVRILGDPQID